MSVRGIKILNIFFFWSEVDWHRKIIVISKYKIFLKPGYFKSIQIISTNLFINASSSSVSWFGIAMRSSLCHWKPDQNPPCLDCMPVFESSPHLVMLSAHFFFLCLPRFLLLKVVSCSITVERLLALMMCTYHFLFLFLMEVIKSSDGLPSCLLMSRTVSLINSY